MTAVNTKLPTPTVPPTDTPRYFLHQLWKLRTSKFTKASSLMFISTIGGGILGYVFQVLMGRMLSLADYGLFITVMALLAVVGVPIGTLSMMVSRRASYYRVKNQPGRTAAMFWWINRRVFWIALATILCALPFTPFLRDYAHLESLVPVWIFLLLTLTALFVPLNIGFLQAQQNFRWLAISCLTANGFKMFFCVTLAYAGFKLSGALMGMVLATMATWMLTYLPLRYVIIQPFGVDLPKDHLSFKGSISLLVSNLSFAMMIHLDLLLVNHYFDPHQAGIYAAAAVLGKAIIYLPTAFSIALFPLAAENEFRSQSSAHFFLNSMMLTACLCGAGAVLYYLFADYIMTLFYGQKYQAAAELLKLYGFAMLPMSLVMVAEHFFITKGRVIFGYLMMLGIPFILFAAHTYHNHPINMLYIFAACGWGVTLVGFGVIGMQHWQHKQ